MKLYIYKNMKIMRHLKILFMTILCYCMFPQLTQSRKTFLVKEHNKRVYQPRVTAYDGSICPWRTTEDRFCLDHNTQVEAGIRWTQVRDLANLLYRLRGIAYVSNDLTIHPEIFFKVFYYNEVTATIDKF